MKAFLRLTPLPSALFYASKRLQLCNKQTEFFNINSEYIKRINKF